MADESSDSRGLLTRFRNVEEATEAFEAISDEQLAEDNARWIELAKAGSRLAYAASMGGGLGDLKGPATELVRALFEVEEAQARLLQSIDENVKLLRDGPFNTGRLYLREANRLVEHPERSVKFIERAQDWFYQAHALATEPIDLAAVEMHIALSAILHGYPDDARHWLEQAYAKAALKANELAEETGNTKVIKGKGIAQAATAYFTLGTSAAFLAAKKIKRTRSDQRARDGLRTVLPLVRCISSLHTASGGVPGELPVLQLVHTRKDEYELVEVTG